MVTGENENPIAAIEAHIKSNLRATPRPLPPTQHPPYLVILNSRSWHDRKE